MNIVLDCKSTGSKIKTKVYVTVKQDDKILKVDEIDLAKEIKRDEFTRKLCTEHPGLGKMKDELNRQLKDKAAELLQDKQDLPEEDNQPLAKSKALLDETDSELVGQAKRLLQNPMLVEKIIDHVHRLGVAGEDDLVAAIYFIGTSRLLNKPLAGLIMGQSSSGKSYVINMVSKLFPDETVLHAHQISPKALQYIESGSLVHRFVVAGERSRLKDDAAAEATRALREMISDGKLSALVSASQKSGPYQTVHIEQEGPIAYIESTTMGVQEIFNEDRTRFILLCSDEGIEQTKAIIDSIAQSVSESGNPDTPDSIIALHHTAQRLLKCNNVDIPFAKQLKCCLPMERVEVRRTFGHLISLIQAVALLYQYQRQLDDYGQIIATREDYEIVRRYLIKPLATSLGCVLTDGAEQLLNILKTIDDEFTVSDVDAKVSCSTNTVRSRLRELNVAGQIRITEGAKGRSGAKYRIVANAPALCGLVLPKLEQNKNSLIYTPETVGDKAQILI